MSEHVETVVVGGSQAGLAVGYCLRRQGRPFVILDAGERVGDAWRNRWDSLHLFTPARYDTMPGMKFPGRPWSYPGKDEVADFLEDYAAKFELPVRLGANVDRLTRNSDGFEVFAGGDSLSAGNVVVATGAYHRQRIPAFASQLDRSINQLRSAEYRNPTQLRDGGVLVVGAGNSGAEIALDIADHHSVWLSGPDTGQEPTRAGSIPDRLLTPLLWLGATRLTVDTRMGRKLRDHFLDPPRGIPLGRVRRKDIAAAGVERVGRTTGVSDGGPVLEDGRRLDVSNVVWCTGFRPDFGWIDLSVPMHNGYPVQDRGVVDAVPGLYFIGLLFLHSLSSALLGGVGRDAGYIAARIAATAAQGSTEESDRAVRR